MAPFKQLLAVSRTSPHFPIRGFCLAIIRVFIVCLKLGLCAHLFSHLRYWCRASQPGQCHCSWKGGLQGREIWPKSHRAIWVYGFFNKKLEDPKHPKTDLTVGVGIFMKCIDTEQLILLFWSRSSWSWAPRPNNISTTWELVRNTGHPRLTRVIGMSTSPSGDSDAQGSLRTLARDHVEQG